jgi:hypothetical protein
VSPSQTFRAHGSRRLRRSRVHGSPVRVALDDGWLAFAGEDPTTLRLPVTAIERMRTGFVDARGGPFYQTILWPAGDRPIKLAPLREDRLLYAAVVRALAAEVAAHRGPGAVERGESRLGALFGPVMIGLVLAAALAVSLFALADEPSLLRWVPVAVPAPLFALLVWRYRAVHRPRPVADLGELDRQLPR